jgi:uncharacterized protein (DUF58 family)
MTLWEIMVGYPGSQDIDQHPYYPYRLAKLAWHIYHHSFTKNGRWFLAGTAIANLSFTMFWSFDIQTWILATAINCIWLPDFIAKLIPMKDMATLSGTVILQTGQGVTLSAVTTSLSPNTLLHFERLPLALVATHDEGFPETEAGIVRMSLTARFRGNWLVPAIRFSRPGPFGLIARSRAIPSHVQVCVLPSIPEMQTVLTARSVTSDWIAAQTARTNTMSTGLDATRTHTPGDPSNRIDWRTSSRSAATSKPALQVRVAQKGAVDGVHIILDERCVVAAVSKWQHWSGRGIREPLPIPEFEALVSLAYASVLSLLKEGQRIGSITSQRQSFTKLHTQDDIAQAFASISHFETPSAFVDRVPKPSITAENAIVFTLLPEQYNSDAGSQHHQQRCVIADLNGIVAEVLPDA